MILHIAVAHGWDIQQIDVKTAFLHGILPEDEMAYLEQLQGFEEPGKDGWVMKLMKSIYGLKQAGRIWNQTFDNAVTGWGFQRMDSDRCMYRRKTETGTVIFAIHVDNIFSITDPPEENANFKALLHSKWEISDLGPAKFTLGIAIERNFDKRSIHLFQTAFIDCLIEHFNLSEAHPTDMPMVQGLLVRRPDKSIPVDPEVAAWVDATPYRELVGSLNYIAVATRPNISFTVGCLASMLDCYQPEHWSAALWVLQYLKGTRTLQLVLGGLTDNTLASFSNSDFANCPNTSCSIAAYCFGLGSGMISWHSKKCDYPTNSSCYSKYTTLHGAAREGIFLQQLLQELGLLESEPKKCPPTSIFCDNDAAVHLSEDSVWHSNTKHFCVKLHYTCDQVQTGELQILCIPSVENVMDILTKSLSRPVFQYLHSHLGIRAPNQDGTTD